MRLFAGRAGGRFIRVRESAGGRKRENRENRIRGRESDANQLMILQQSVPKVTAFEGKRSGDYAEF